VLAGADRLHHDGGLQVRRQRHVDDVYLRIAQEVLDAAMNPLDPLRRGDTARVRLRPARDRRDAKPGRLIARDVRVLDDVAGSDEADPEPPRILRLRPHVELIAAHRRAHDATATRRPPPRLDS
jgi:hypothetical protein